MEIRWLTGFIDRRPDSFDAATGFWQDVTGTTLSSPRGRYSEFATLLPPDGDAYLRVQRVRSGLGGSHLDLHVDDPAAAAAAAVEAGAGPVEGDHDVAILRSPAGLLFCVVSYGGERIRPKPRSIGDSSLQFRVDQFCIDIPANRFDDECAFWPRITGWTLRPSTVRPEFARLAVPDTMPLRLLLQRRNDEDGPARAHLDIASDDRGALARQLTTMGAEVSATFDHWIVMTDPAGIEFCVTARDPRTGPLSG